MEKTGGSGPMDRKGRDNIIALKLFLVKSIPSVIILFDQILYYYVFHTEVFEVYDDIISEILICSKMLH